MVYYMTYMSYDTAVWSLTDFMSPYLKPIDN